MRIDIPISSNIPGKKRIRPGKAVVATVLVLVGLILIGLILIPVTVIPMFLGQRYERPQYDSMDYGIPSERIILETDDSLALAAWRTRAVDPKGTVIILSGIQNPSVTAFFGYAKWFSDNGWDALLIEMRARSLSEGDEIGFGMTEWLDVKAGVDFLDGDERAGNLPIVAMGTSMGGSTVIIAAGELQRIDAVISLSAFSSVGTMFAEFMAMSGLPIFIGMMDIPFLNLYLGLHFGFDTLNYTAANGIAKMGGRPVLLMHSTGDTQVPYPEFDRLLKTAARHGIHTDTFIREGDEHFICYMDHFDDPSQDTEFAQAILGFLAKIAIK